MFVGMREPVSSISKGPSPNSSQFSDDLPKSSILDVANLPQCMLYVRFLSFNHTCYSAASFGFAKSAAMAARLQYLL